VALNVALDALRVSRAIDVFHDTETAVGTSWDEDRRLLEADGFIVTVLRERPGFVQATVGGGAASVVMEWVRDHALAFDGPPPDAGALSAQWHPILASGREIVDRLPRAHAGEAVLAGAGDLFRGDGAALARAIGDDALRFHAGRIGGALPVIVG
jgi:hypothetical protein